MILEAWRPLRIALRRETFLHQKISDHARRFLDPGKACDVRDEVDLTHPEEYRFSERDPTVRTALERHSRADS